MKTTKTVPPTPIATAVARVDLCDALTSDLERADALTTHLAERLADLDSQDGAPPELYALSLIAESIREKQARILDKARALHRGAAESGVTPDPMTKGGAR